MQAAAIIWQHRRIGQHDRLGPGTDRIYDAVVGRDFDRLKSNMDSERKYLRDVLPRFYEDVEDTLKCDWPELLPQLERLYIVDRCSCGQQECRTFSCESDDPRYCPINGRRPFSYSIKRVDGVYQVSDDGVLSGFEILSDYWDGSLERGLTAAGFPARAS